MGVSYSNDSIDKLKENIDIVEVIGRTISIKKQGANYKACCPFHGEKTPSFVVSPDKQIFKCFGCGVSGDAIEFVRKYYNLDFVSAIEKLAKETGVELEHTKYDDRRDDYYTANAQAGRHFFKNFIKKTNPAADYMMNKRGLTMDTIKKFGIGYADSDWSSLYYDLKEKNDEKIMTELGLISRNKGNTYDRFRNRVMFPIINTRGKVIGFGGRALADGQGAKYINSPDNVIFHKGNNLFALNFAREHLREADYLIVTEGYMDTIALYQAGIKNVVASLGTALTENHGRLLKRYVKKVVLSYDSDDAGRKAAFKGVDVLRRAGLDVYVLHVDHGKDPDEYVREYGRERFLNLVKTSLPALKYQLKYIERSYDLGTDKGRVNYIKAVMPVFDTMEPADKEIYAKELAKELGISWETILSQNAYELEKRPQITPRRRQQANRPALTMLEQQVLMCVLLDQELINVIDAQPGILETDLGREIFKLIKCEFSQGDGSIDDRRIKDGLNPEDWDTYDGIINNNFISDPKKTIIECVNRWKIGQYSKDKEKILAQIDLAEISGADVVDLQAKMIEIDNEIKRLKKLIV